jgi:hypothetical protein
MLGDTGEHSAIGDGTTRADRSAEPCQSLIGSDRSDLSRESGWRLCMESKIHGSDFSSDPTLLQVSWFVSPPALVVTQFEF